MLRVVRSTTRRTLRQARLTHSTTLPSSSILLTPLPTSGSTHHVDQQPVSPAYTPSRWIMTASTPGQSKDASQGQSQSPSSTTTTDNGNSENKETNNGRSGNAEGKEKNGKDGKKWYSTSFSTKATIVMAGVLYWYWCKKQKEKTVKEVQKQSGLDKDAANVFSEIALLTTEDVSNLHDILKKHSVKGKVHLEIVDAMVRAQVEVNREKRKEVREKLAAEEARLEEEIRRELEGKSSQSGEDDKTKKTKTETTETVSDNKGTPSGSGSGSGSSDNSGGSAYIPTDLANKLSLGDDWVDNTEIDSAVYRPWQATSLFPSVEVVNNRVDVADAALALSMLIEEYDTPTVKKIMKQGLAPQVLEPGSQIRKALEKRANSEPNVRRRVDFVPDRRLMVAWVVECYDYLERKILNEKLEKIKTVQAIRNKAASSATERSTGGGILNRGRAGLTAGGSSGSSSSGGSGSASGNVPSDYRELMTGPILPPIENTVKTLAKGEWTSSTSTSTPASESGSSTPTGGAQKGRGKSSSSSSSSSPTDPILRVAQNRLPLTEVDHFIDRLIKTGHFKAQSLVVPDNNTWWPVRYKALTAQQVTDSLLKELGYTRETVSNAGTNDSPANDGMAHGKGKAVNDLSLLELHAALRRSSWKGGPHLWYYDPDTCSEKSKFDAWRSRTYLNVVDGVIGLEDPREDPEATPGMARWRMLGK